MRAMIYKADRENILGIRLPTAAEISELPEHLKSINDIYWLQDPGAEYNHAMCVRQDGTIDNTGIRVDHDFPAVRPIITMEKAKSSHNWEIYSSDDVFFQYEDKIKFEGFGNKLWIYIGNNQFLCDEPVAIMPFRNDAEAKNANNYDASDIKWNLYDWLENWIGVDLLGERSQVYEACNRDLRDFEDWYYSQSPEVQKANLYKYCLMCRVYEAVTDNDFLENHAAKFAGVKNPITELTDRMYDNYASNILNFVEDAVNDSYAKEHHIKYRGNEL